MQKRKFSVLVALLVLTFSVSAQASFSDLFGSQMSLGESLVNFVNSVTTFNLSTPGEVLLYVLAPLVGFYFLIKNFLAIGYEMFEDRIDRPEFEKYDELPNGFKAFSAVTSVIAVLTLGAYGAGLLFFIALASFLLLAMMFAGLGTAGNRNDNNNAAGAPATQNNGNSTGNGNQNNGNNGGSSLADVLDSAANLMGNAQNVSQNLQQNANQNNMTGLQESLKFFDNDMIDEIDYVNSNIGSIRSLIQNAESEFSSGSFDKNSFQTVSRRIGNLNGTLNRYNRKIDEDMTGPGSRNWGDNNCELKNFHNSVSPGIYDQAKMIKSQLESILNDEKVPPSDDSLRKLMDSHLDYMVAVGHFMVSSPYSLHQIATDQSKAEEVIQIAENMGKVQDRSNRNESRILMQLCSALENQSDPENVLKEAEQLCKRELEIDQGEMEFFKKFLKSDGELIEQLEKIENLLQYYSNIPNSFKTEVHDTKVMITEAMTEASKMESSVQQHGKYESEAYQALRNFESKI